MSWITLFLLQTLSASLLAEPLVLSTQNTQHIKFQRIPANHYRFEANSLYIEVESSASFLLLPFKQETRISTVHFDWKLQTGKLNIETAADEEQRAGDDSIFKLGLMLAGPAQLPSLFVPEWLQQVNQAMFFPSNKIMYLVAGAKHKAGEHWPNPYNKRVEMIAAQHRTLDANWSEASYNFEPPINVVGLWLMADGDDSQSTFTTRLKSIRLE